MRVRKVWEVKMGNAPLYSGLYAGNKIISGDAYGDIGVVSLDGKILVKRNVTSGGVLSFGYYESLLVCGTSNNEVIFIDEDGRLVKTINVPGKVFSILVKDGVIWCGSSGGEIIAIDMACGGAITVAKLSTGKIRQIKALNGKIAFCCQDGYMRIMDVDSMDVVRAWWSHKLSANCFVVDEGGRWCITGGRDAYIRKWDMSFNIPAMTHEIPAHMNAIYGMALAGNYLITTSMDKSIRIWDISSLEIVKHIDRDKGGHSFSVNGVLILSENLFATYSDDKKIILWEIEREEHG